jgi:hypothetical protein
MGIAETAITRSSPKKNRGEKLPLTISNSELEKTIKAIQAGSMQMNVVTA